MDKDPCSHGSIKKILSFVEMHKRSEKHWQNEHTAESKTKNYKVLASYLG